MADSGASYILDADFFSSSGACSAYLCVVGVNLTLLLFNASKAVVVI